MTPKFCPECGTKAPSVAAKFCSSCGTSLDIFATQKTSPTKRIAAKQIDEEDEDGSDVYELPNISSLKAKIEGDEEYGFKSFTFGQNGFVPTSFARTRR